METNRTLDRIQEELYIQNTLMFDKIEGLAGSITLILLILGHHGASCPIFRILIERV
jgi:hypothetical protein